MLNITEVKRDIDTPLPIDENDDSEAINDVIVTRELSYTPSKRGGTIAVDTFDKIFSSFNKGKKSNLYVRIQDDSGSTIYAIPINKREDGIQRDISDVINFLITQ